MSQSAFPPAFVRRAERRDVAPLALALARAFDDDPFYNWLLPLGPRRAERFTAIFALILSKMSDGLEQTFTTTDNCGAALWLQPGAHELSLWARARLMPSFAKILGWPNIPRGLRIMDHMDALRARYAPRPHYYLSVLGVDPSRQGRGVASALRKPMFERCDRQRRMAYLETARQKNIAFYERHGFTVAAETAHRDFPTFWSMKRDPRC